MINNLLNGTEEQVKELVNPADAIKLIRRLRKVSFFIRVNAELITDRDETAGTYRYFPAGHNIKVSAAQATDFLKDLSDTADRLSRRETNPLTAKVELTRLGECLFIG